EENKKYSLIETIYDCFLKFSTDAPLEKNRINESIKFHVLCDNSKNEKQDKIQIKEYFKSIDKRLNSYGKKGNFESYFEFGKFLCKKDLFLKIDEPIKVGKWMKTLFCIVPIQICRAEGNQIILLDDGLVRDFKFKDNKIDSILLSSKLRFGLFDSI